MRAFHCTFDQRGQTFSLEPHDDVEYVGVVDDSPSEFWFEFTRQHLPGADARKVRKLAQHLVEQTGEPTSAVEMVEYASEHPEWAVN
jgi:hypothetical protein